jgi:hypothetical protein
MKEALGSSETSVLTRATRRNIPEDTILHSHRRENLKSYIENICYDFLNGIYTAKLNVLILLEVYTQTHVDSPLCFILNPIRVKFNIQLRPQRGEKKILFLGFAEKPVNVVKETAHVSVIIKSFVMLMQLVQVLL